MAQRQRSVLLAAAACVVLVLTLLLLLAAPPPEELRDRVMQFAASRRGPEEAAERDDAAAAYTNLDGEEQPVDDPDFYGDFPMFESMMGPWLQNNISRFLKQADHRLSRGEFADEWDLLMDKMDNA